MLKSRKAKRQAVESVSTPEQQLFKKYKFLKNVLPSFTKEADFSQAYKITKAFAKVFSKFNALNYSIETKVHKPNISCALFENVIEGNMQTSILIVPSAIKDKNYTTNITIFIKNISDNSEILEVKELKKLLLDNSIDIFILTSVSDKTAKTLKLFESLLRTLIIYRNRKRKRTKTL
jgi:hypothetical protein